jgi:hypothetical protein
MLKFEIAKKTACLMLKDQEGNLVDYQFVNKLHFENWMTWDELQQEIQSFFKRNNITGHMAINWA